MARIVEAPESRKGQDIIYQLIDDNGAVVAEARHFMNLRRIFDQLRAVAAERGLTVEK
jgi:hypothetical protein